MSNTIRDFKSYTSKVIFDEIVLSEESRREWMLKLFSNSAARHKRNSNFQFWTHENHAELIYSNKFIEQKLNYIHNNPVKAGIVERPEHYLYSSANNYAGEKGLLEVSLLTLKWRTCT